MSVSTKINDGGPAFPRPYSAEPLAARAGISEQAGMSLRDWFAGQALMSLVEEMPPRENPGVSAWKEYIAAKAYAFADAMIAARSKP